MEAAIHESTAAHANQLTTVKHTKPRSQISRDRELEFDPNDIDEDAWEHVIIDAEETLGVPDGTLTTKQIRSEAKRELRQRKANKRKSELRKRAAEEKVSVLVYSYVMTLYFIIHLYLFAYSRQFQDFSP